MKFISLSLTVLGLAIGIKAQLGPLDWPRECNSTTIETPNLTEVDKKGIAAYENSPAFAGLKKRMDTIGYFGKPFTCQVSYSCIAIAKKTKLLCLRLGKEGITSTNKGEFVTEEGTTGSLRDGNFLYGHEFAVKDTRGNFLTGPYPSPTRTSTSDKYIPTCAVIGKYTKLGCTDTNTATPTPTTGGVAAKTNDAVKPKTTSVEEECGAVFMIGTKTAAGCLSTTAKAGGSTGAAVANNFGLGMMALGVAGAGLAGL